MKESSISNFCGKVFGDLLQLRSNIVPRSNLVLIDCWIDTLVQTCLYQLKKRKLVSSCWYLYFFDIKDKPMVFPLIVYCQHIRNQVVMEKMNTKNKNSQLNLKNKDYPAMAVACRNRVQSDVFFGASFGEGNLYQTCAEKGNEYPRSEVIREAIDDLKKKKIECKNKVGSCAEPHAADEAIFRTKCTIGDLKFSVALRPRTMLMKDYCPNCQAMFPYCKSHQIK